MFYPKKKFQFHSISLQTISWNIESEQTKTKLIFARECVCERERDECVRVCEREREVFGCVCERDRVREVCVCERERVRR